MDSAKQEFSVAVKGNFMVLTTPSTLTFADTVAEREDTFAVFEEKLAVFEEKLRNSQASGKEGIVESKGRVFPEEIGIFEGSRVAEGVKFSTVTKLAQNI